jgi:hypothetical protein
MNTYIVKSLIRNERGFSSEIEEAHFLGNVATMTNCLTQFERKCEKEACEYYSYCDVHAIASNPSCEYHPRGVLMNAGICFYEEMNQWLRNSGNDNRGLNLVRNCKMMAKDLYFAWLSGVLSWFNTCGRLSDKQNIQLCTVDALGTYECGRDGIDYQVRRIENILSIASLLQRPNSIVPCFHRENSICIDDSQGSLTHLQQDNILRIANLNSPSYCPRHHNVTLQTLVKQTQIVISSLS